MNRDKGMKAIIAILVIVCVLQMGSISSLKSDVQNLKNSEVQLRRLLEEQSAQIEALESEFYAESHMADTSFGITNVNWEEGRVQFEFTVTPVNITESMRVVVNNTLTSVELTRSGNSYVGTLEYPFDEKTYETSYYIYEGDNEKGSGLIEWLGASTWAAKAMNVSFEGSTFYGNDRFTIAGTMHYYFNIPEELKSLKVVFQDEEIAGDMQKEGTVDINLSKQITIDAENCFKEIYMEFTTASGTIYQVYPTLLRDLMYDMEHNKESLNATAGQLGHMTIIMSDGTIYETSV